MKLFDNENLGINFIEDFVFHYSGSAHIKDINSGKYLFSNKINVSKLGFSVADDIYGMTVRDLDRQICHLWGNLAERIEVFEQAIRARKEIILDLNQLSILPSGFLAVHNMKKFPLLNQQGKPLAIITTSDQITNQIDLLQLFELYQKFFQTQFSLVMINKFLNFIQVFDYFDNLPTTMELKILLYKHKFRTSKVVAGLLQLSTNTVETHLYRVRHKINTDLNTLLSQIRPI